MWHRISTKFTWSTVTCCRGVGVKKKNKMWFDSFGLPWWLSGKEYVCNAGDMSLIPGQEDYLEKEIATHSSILAWEISRTEESGGL